MSFKKIKLIQIFLILVASPYLLGENIPILDRNNNYLKKEMICKYNKYHRVASFEVPSYMLRSSIQMKVLSSDIHKKNLIIEIVGYQNDIRVEREIIYNPTIGKLYTYLPRSGLLTTEEYHNLKYYVSLNYYELDTINNRREAKVEIELIFDAEIFSNNEYVYFIISLLLTIAILILLNDKIYNTLLQKKYNNKLIHLTQFTAKSLIFILILDECGLFLQEWGFDIKFFNLIRLYMGLPGISQITLIASYIILIPLVYRNIYNLLGRVNRNAEILKTFRTTSKFTRYNHNISLYVSLFVFNISVLLFFVQCFAWNEFDSIESRKYSFAHWIDLVIIFLPLFPLFAISKKSNKINRQYNITLKSTYLNKRILFIMLFVLFVSFAQSIIVKVVVLFEIINWCKNKLFLILKKSYKATYLRLENILPTKTSSQINLFNFLFLNTTVFTLIFIWVFANNPFPPTGSIYSKYITISFLYSSYIFFYFILINRKKESNIKSIIWLTYSFIVLYLSPLLLPNLFKVSINGNVLSTFIIEDIGLERITIGLFIFQIFVLFYLYTTFKSWDLGSILEKEKYSNDNRFRLFFFISMYFRPFIIMFVLTVLIYLLLSEPIAIKSFTIQNDFYLVLLLASILVSLFYWLIPLDRQVETIFHSVNSQISQNKKILFINKHKYLRLFKAFNNGQLSITGISLYCCFGLLLIALNFVIFNLPYAFASSTSEIHSYYKFNSMKLPIEVVRTKNKLVVGTHNRLFVFNSKNYKHYESRHLECSHFEIINDSLCWLINSDKILLIDILNGNDILRGHYIYKTDTTHYRSFRPEEIVCFSRRTNLFLQGSTLWFLNKISGDIDSNYYNVKRPILSKFEGNFAWIDIKNRLHINSNDYPKIYSLPDDPILKIFSLKEGLVLVSKEFISYYNSDGQPLWKIKTTSVTNINTLNEIQVSIIGEIMIIAYYSDNIMGVNKFTGAEIWTRNDCSYIHNYEPIGFNELKIFKEGVFVNSSDSKYSYLVDVKTGLSKFKFKNLGTSAIYGDYYYTMNLSTILVYSLITNKLIYEDDYIISMAKMKQFYFSRLPNAFTPLQMLAYKNYVYWVSNAGVFCLKLKI